MNKKLTIYFVWLVCGTMAIAQPEAPKSATAGIMDVPPVELRQMEKSQYQSTAVAMEEALKENPLNESAWLNLYKATRYASYTTHTRTISAEAQVKLNKILARMNNAVPNSYAYNYCAYLNANHTDESFEYLKRANNLRPSESELWDDMVCMNMIKDNQAESKKWCTQLENAGIYNAAQMEYNRNVLNSLEQNAILVTNGNVDTYPILILQQVYGVRSDVRTICLDWFGSKEYVEMIHALTGIKVPKNKTADASTGISSLLEGSKSNNIYLALTLPPEILKKEAKNLYCTGLAMKHSKTELQNLDVLRYNWETFFQKSHISSDDEINRNYLVPLLLLKKYYTTLGNTANADTAKTMAEEIATRFAITGQIKKQLE